MSRNGRPPKWFQELYWWGDAKALGKEEHKKSIVVQIIDRGQWKHWRWMIRTYGKEPLKKLIKEIPASEFRPRALRLVSLLLGIKGMKYASRSDYLKAKKTAWASS